MTDGRIGGGVGDGPRTAAPVTQPVALTVAGSDSGGGAGVQADLAAMRARGVFATAAVTSVTAQHTRGVESAYTLPVEEIQAQVDAVRGDFDVAAVKTGMLAEAAVVEAVRDLLADADFPVVVDPVMVASSGDRLLTEAGEAAYEDLIAEAALVTPNRDEAAVLTGIDPADSESARAAGEAMLDMGADAALVKGGHADGNGSEAVVTDVLVTDAGTTGFSHPRIDTDATHGTGCTLSAAIAAGLARGESLETAVGEAIDQVVRGLRYPLDVGQGPGAVHGQAGLRNRAARERVAETVRETVDRLARDLPLADLVPEVGLNVVGATPYAESVEETAAVEGRITRTLDGAAGTGVTTGRPVRFGASSHVARVLLAAREHHPAYRFAANVRHDDATGPRLAALDGEVGRFDREAEPAEADTMDWGTARAFESADGIPAAVADGGAVGKEPMLRVLAETPDELVERLGTLAGAAR